MVLSRCDKEMRRNMENKFTSDVSCPLSRLNTAIDCLFFTADHIPEINALYCIITSSGLRISYLECSDIPPQ
jgi:hypothetical protein